MQRKTIMYVYEGKQIPEFQCLPDEANYAQKNANYAHGGKKDKTCGIMRTLRLRRTMNWKCGENEWIILI